MPSNTVGNLKGMCLGSGASGSRCLAHSVVFGCCNSGQSMDTWNDMLPEGFSARRVVY